MKNTLFIFFLIFLIGLNEVKGDYFYGDEPTLESKETFLEENNNENVQDNMQEALLKELNTTQEVPSTTTKIIDTNFENLDNNLQETIQKELKATEEIPSTTTKIIPFNNDQPQNDVIVKEVPEKDSKTNEIETYYDDDYDLSPDLIEQKENEDVKPEEVQPTTTPSIETVEEDLDSKKEGIHSNTKETTTEKGFNLLYVFVPVVAIAGIVLVVALAVIFKKIAVAKKKNSNNETKGKIYRQVPTNDV
ncbi:unnamed protein product [Brachionus calyciflorus]|uniref:Uncharacterized protein n=1 Tax=Brachionus calyciflorus TaxID=104777 RepID=A0A814DKB7_9BILA|nr:unnamed protein product [Brachionus calyciflorus]